MNQQRKEIEPEIESQIYAEDSLKSLENFVRELQGKVDNLNFEERRELLKLPGRSVAVKEDGIVDVEVIVPQVESQLTRDSESWKKQPAFFPSIAQLRHRACPCNWGKSTQTSISIVIRPVFVPKKRSSSLTKSQPKRMVRPFVKISLNQYKELDRLREEKKESLSKLIREALCSFTKKKGHPIDVLSSFLPALTRGHYKIVTAYFPRDDWNMLERLSKNTGRCKTELLRKAVEEYLRKLL